MTGRFVYFFMLGIMLVLSCSTEAKSQALAQVPTASSASHPVEGYRPRQSMAAVAVKVGAISYYTMRQIQGWARDKNKNVLLQDSCLIWPSVGARGDSAIVNLAGALRIYAFAPIGRIADIDAFYSSYSTVYADIKGGSGGTFPPCDEEGCWDSNSVVFDARSNIYKRIVINEFALSYTLNIPECRVREARWRVNARYSFAPYDRPVNFNFGDTCVREFKQTFQGECANAPCTQAIDITSYCRFGSWPLRISSPHGTLRMHGPLEGQRGPQMKMVLEFLLSNPCESNFVVTDAQGRAVSESSSNRLFVSNSRQ
ncbi:MAG: hypothetical protein NTX17_07655 [Candidatus Eisenbacteria bacterium]|nr:hypothetical protein [Candidatus Eisenbacteria bacterium]